MDFTDEEQVKEDAYILWTWIGKFGGGKVPDGDIILYRTSVFAEIKVFKTLHEAAEWIRKVYADG